MTASYITRQGETLDSACQAHYGRTVGVVETVLAANDGLALKGPVLPMGTAIIMPAIDLKAEARVLVKLWE